MFITDNNGKIIKPTDEKASIKILRLLAGINKKEGGIFEKYCIGEINMLTKRQLLYMFKIEKKYKELKERKYE